MKTRTYLLLTTALAIMAAVPAFAETQTVVTKEVNADGMGGTTTTTTRYYYNDTDANNNGILDSQEFPRFVYNSWDLNGDGFVEDSEWNMNTALWYPAGSTEYKTYTHWDKDQNGRLDPDEFGTVVTTTKLYDTWDADHNNVINEDEYTDARFRVYDTNDDGALNMQEWRSIR
ncbi:MAG TPA: hypothetical protein PKX38_02415 [Alphaproteobacteria bacterium]|jgi:Ca2+-binding EF-hand superfamily protein|nr:hypothetical protein [Micavibrio sp.]MBK9562419.1 hypothetical protein [Micavibrio sp.]HQX26772.1 hypothetical protein [Alphaproteobacteria bacterium]